MKYLLLNIILSNTIFTIIEQNIIPYPTIKITASPLTDNDKKILSTLDEHFFPNGTRNFKDELKTLFNKFKRDILPKIKKELFESNDLNTYEIIFEESDEFKKLKDYKPDYNFLEKIFTKPDYIYKGYAYISHKIPDEYINTLFDLYYLISLHIITHINASIKHEYDGMYYKNINPELYKFNCFFRYLMQIIILDIRIGDLKYYIKGSYNNIARMFFPEIKKEQDPIFQKTLRLDVIEHYYSHCNNINNHYKYVTSNKKEKIRYIATFIYEYIEYRFLNLTFETILWYTAACYNNKLWKSITDVYEATHFEIDVFQSVGTFFDPNCPYVKATREAAQFLAYQQLLNRKK